MNRTFTNTLYFPTTYTVTVDGGSHLNHVERVMALLNITEIKHPRLGILFRTSRFRICGYHWWKSKHIFL